MWVCECVCMCVCVNLDLYLIKFWCILNFLENVPFYKKTPVIMALHYDK